MNKVARSVAGVVLVKGIFVDLIFFPFSEYWWFYAGFMVFVLLMLAADLGIFHRTAHRVTMREAAIWSAVWVSLALVFNYLLYLYAHWKIPQMPQAAGLDSAAIARQLGIEFFTGFLIEKSLSIDNLFVFVAIFAFFAVPEKYQHRVLFYGIIGALIFRAIFIAAGSVLMEHKWIVLIFGGLLIFTGIKMFFAPQHEIDPSKNYLLRFLKKFMPITSSIEGERFFVRKNGVLYGTPLFLALVFVEFSDIIFAVDSVPAIFAITREPLIVFTSNIFAILGLRSLYFLLAGVYHKFYLLKFGLGIVLIFVGLKMVWLNDLYGGKFPIGWSLAFISGVISISVIISLLRPKAAPVAHT